MKFSGTDEVPVSDYYNTLEGHGNVAYLLKKQLHNHAIFSNDVHTRFSNSTFNAVVDTIKAISYVNFDTEAELLDYTRVITNLLVNGYYDTPYLKNDCFGKDGVHTTFPRYKYDIDLDCIVDNEPFTLYPVEVVLVDKFNGTDKELQMYKQGIKKMVHSYKRVYIVNRKVNANNEDKELSYYLTAQYIDSIIVCPMSKRKVTVVPKTTYTFKIPIPVILVVDPNNDKVYPISIEPLIYYLDLYNKKYINRIDEKPIECFDITTVYLNNKLTNINELIKQYKYV
nr:MAG TPA: hypothetical protein [Crassvirales sp.]